MARIAVFFATLPNLDMMIAYFNNGLNGISFKFSDSSIYAGAKPAEVQFGATGIPITTGRWYVIDIHVNQTANPHLVDVMVDGRPCGQYSQALAAANVTTLTIGCALAVTWDMYCDDVLVSATAADYPLGPGHVDHFVPTADGAHNVAGTADFRRTLTATDILNSTTDAYLLVDGVPLIATDITAVECISLVAPPNATDYVQCVFGPAPGISRPNMGPRFVEVIGTLQTASAGGTPTMDLSLRINDNGTIADIFTSSVFYQPSTPVFKRAGFATAPSTGAAWTAALFNALQVRFGSFDAADSAPDGYFGAIMIEAEFPEHSPPLTLNNLARERGRRMPRQSLRRAVRYV